MLGKKYNPSFFYPLISVSIVFILFTSTLDVYGGPSSSQSALEQNRISGSKQGVYLLERLNVVLYFLKLTSFFFYHIMDFIAFIFAATKAQEFSPGQ